MKKLSLAELELLLKDISARLHYGLKCKAKQRVGTFLITDLYGGGKGVGGYFIDENRSFVYPTIEVTPYLRRLSSMTDEEKKEYHKLCDNYYDLYFDTVDSIDWLNKKMFAYRTIGDKDMFELGLALEATDEMYK